MAYKFLSISQRAAAVLLLTVSAAALAGCQQKAASLDGADPMNTASTGGSYKDVAKLGAAYQADPDDPAKAIAFSNALGGIGQTAKQLEVLRKLHASHPGDAKIGAIYGKKLLGAGQTGDAIPVLEAAAGDPTADWRVDSALGSAYDQTGKFEAARSQYVKALAKKPGEPGVLNNMGMSYILQGDLKNAEATLRQAAASPSSKQEPRIRQNLALAVGLQGRFDEAREIASKDLPPDQVEANMAYLQQMLSKSNTWAELSKDS